MFVLAGLLDLDEILTLYCKQTLLLNLPAKLELSLEPVEPNYLEFRSIK